MTTTTKTKRARKPAKPVLAAHDAPCRACGSAEPHGPQSGHLYVAPVAADPRSFNQGPLAVATRMTTRGISREVVVSEPVLDRFSLYFTDNGRIVCGQHAGMSALYTGRDISGQEVEVVTAEVVAEWIRTNGDLPLCCEDCGRRFGDVGDRERDPNLWSAR